MSSSNDTDSLTLKGFVESERYLTWPQAQKLFDAICRALGKDKKKEIRLAPEQILLNGVLELAKIAPANDAAGGMSLPELLKYALGLGQKYKKDVPAAVYKLVARKDLFNVHAFENELKRAADGQHRRSCLYGILTSIVCVSFCLCCIVNKWKKKMPPPPEPPRPTTQEPDVKIPAGEVIWFLKEVQAKDSCLPEQREKISNCRKDVVEKCIDSGIKSGVVKCLFTVAFEEGLCLLYNSNLKPKDKKEQLDALNAKCVFYNELPEFREWNVFYKAVSMVMAQEMTANQNDDGQPDEETKLQREQNKLKCTYLCQQWHNRNWPDADWYFPKEDRVCRILWTASVPALPEDALLNMSLEQKKARITPDPVGGDANGKTQVSWTCYVRQKRLEKTKIVLTISDKDNAEDFKLQAWLPEKEEERKQIVNNESGVIEKITLKRVSSANNYPELKEKITLSWKKD